MGLVPATWGAPMAACPCIRGSETPARIWPEPASHPRGGSRAATSLLCPWTGILWGQGPHFSWGAVTQARPCREGRGGPGTPPLPWSPPCVVPWDFSFGTPQSFLVAGSGHPWDPRAPILRGSDERGADGVLLPWGSEVPVILKSWLALPSAPKSTFSPANPAGSERTFLCWGVCVG